MQWLPETYANQLANLVQFSTYVAFQISYPTGVAVVTGSGWTWPSYDVGGE